MNFTSRNTRIAWITVAAFFLLMSFTSAQVPPITCPGGCNDGNPCTSDMCLLGSCTHMPQIGQLCEDDGNECTYDQCDINGDCTHPVKEDGETCGSEATCISGQCVSCFMLTCDMFGYECGSFGNGCGGTMNCGTCETGENCDSGYCVECVPDCSGKDCGGDGCGGSCGTCESGYYCESGICEQESTTTISEGCSEGCDDGNDCTLDYCNIDTCMHVPRIGEVCTDDGNSCTDDVCNVNGACTHPAVADETPCENSGVCMSGVCSGQCFPFTCQAFGYECGIIPNGCGGQLNCGTCDSGEVCEAGQCVSDCVPNCANKNCGDDGCGGSCGTCTEYPNSYCHDSGQCSCKPLNCVAEGYTCGSYDSGCGGTTECGSCTTGYNCEAGTCVPESTTTIPVIPTPEYPSATIPFAISGLIVASAAYTIRKYGR